MDSFTPQTSKQYLSVADLRDFGDRFGIDYRFPSQAASPACTTVLRGKVDELPLASGLHLTHSSLEVLRPYETLSTGNTAFFLLVVLEGCVQLTIAGRQHVARPGMAVTMRLDANSSLRAFHAPEQSLKTLTVALNTGPDAQDMLVPRLLDGFSLPQAPSAHLWHVPGHIYQSLQHWQATPVVGALPQRLLLEGLALQLLAYGIGDAPSAMPRALSPGERARLDNIRRQLDQAPGLDYSVHQLAEQAAMSTSSFRSKFRLMYGMPVAGYLRERRLELARQYLQQGYSVQQAAHLSGYRHTTNFATAFRKHYGTAPSSVA